MARVELRTEFMASGVRCVCLASFGVTRSTVTGSPRTAPVAHQEGPCDVKAWYEGLLARHFRHRRLTSVRRPPATSTGPSAIRPRDSRVVSREAGLATQAPPHWQACWQRTVCVAQHDIAVRAGGGGASSAWLHPKVHFPILHWQSASCLPGDTKKCLSPTPPGIHPSTRKHFYAK